MHWQDHGITLHQHLLGEKALRLTLLTREHGLHHGTIKRSRRKVMSYDISTVVDVTWKARLEDHLGVFYLEEKENYLHGILSHPLKLAGVQAAVALCYHCLPERDPCPPVFNSLYALLQNLGAPSLAPRRDQEAWSWVLDYIAFEMTLLRATSMGLQMNGCAAHQPDKHDVACTQDPAYLSPRTGRSVCEAAAAPYKDKLLPLPRFLTQGAWAAGQFHLTPTPPQDTYSLKKGLEALEISRYFFERTFFAPHGISIPDARARFITLLQKKAK